MYGVVVLEEPINKDELCASAIPCMLNGLKVTSDTDTPIENVVLGPNGLLGIHNEVSAKLHGAVSKQLRSNALNIFKLILLILTCFHIVN